LSPSLRAIIEGAKNTAEKFKSLPGCNKVTDERTDDRQTDGRLMS